jgi:hypothetical protein
MKDKNYPGRVLDAYDRTMARQRCVDFPKPLKLSVRFARA